MNCGYSREILALYIEDDLPTPDAARKVESHIARCAECRQYCEQLRGTQLFIRSQFKPVHPGSVSQETLTGVRRSVMAQIEPVRQSLPWSLKLERLLFLGFKRPRFAAVSFAVLAVVSASLLGQMRYSSKNMLAVPSDYRQWVVVGTSNGEQHSNGNVYMNPTAYQEYEQSGKFPEGTMMILESAGRLQVSVKDKARFEDGWGFFDFANSTERSERLPETAGCISCHRDKAATDHVFTQFYPSLKL